MHSHDNTQRTMKFFKNFFTISEGKGCCRFAPWPLGYFPPRGLAQTRSARMASPSLPPRQLLCWRPNLQQNLSSRQPFLCRFFSWSVLVSFLLFSLPFSRFLSSPCLLQIAVNSKQGSHSQITTTTALF